MYVISGEDERPFRPTRQNVGQALPRTPLKTSYTSVF